MAGKSRKLKQLPSVRCITAAQLWLSFAQELTERGGAPLPAV